MSELGEQIVEGLQDALEYSKGERKGRQTHHIMGLRRVNIKALRRRLRMSQKEFATTFGFSLHLLQEWEQGKRLPEGAARALLLVIAKSPEIVRNAIAEASK